VLNAAKLVQFVLVCELNRGKLTMETVPLQNVFLHVTKACNLKCEYCYFSASRPLPDELSTDEFVALWPDLIALRPAKIVFTGGEPLLRHDIVDLLSSLRDADPTHHVLRCLNTNGHLVTPDFARSVVGLADEVRVSIDALESRNDGLRGNGNFAAAIRALETYYSVGFEPKALVTVTAFGLPDLEELICFLVQRQITRINLNVFRPIGRGGGRPELVPSAESIRLAVGRAMDRCYSSQPPVLDPQPECQSHCGVGRFLNIMPNGDVFPCHVLTTREFCCGNVRQARLSRICSERGLLGALAHLDFKGLAEREARLKPLTLSGSCLGDVYAVTKDSEVWKRSIPLRVVPAGQGGAK
jgi:MoaA/NifB/PqqE/SkfB family radical SAM enzyme